MHNFFYSREFKICVYGLKFTMILMPTRPVNFAFSSFLVFILLSSSNVNNRIGEILALASNHSLVSLMLYASLRS